MSSAPPTSTLDTLLNGVSTAVMLADSNFNITFLNAPAEKLFHEAEAQLASLFPGFRAHDLVGRNMDVFHVRPSHQRALLADPSRLPHTTRIQVEGLVISLQVNALRKVDGSLDGFILEWADETARSLYEAELRELRSAAAAGDLSYRGDVNRMEGEFARILALVNELFGGMSEVVQTTGEALQRAADGDLSQPITAPLVGDQAALKEDFNRMIASLSNTMRQVQTASDHMAAGSAQVSSTAQSLAHGATTQAAAIEQIGATVEQVAREAEQTAQAARKSDGMSHRASESAARGEESMASMLDAMRNIEDASREISRIIKVIDEIAFQTNLLALNAAVEAARAGAHGRGFAVVAEEVRNLAARSARAAKETTSMIENTLQRVEEGSSAAHRTADSLSEIVDSVAASRAIIQRIAGAADAQAASVAEVHSGLQQIDRVTQQNTAAAEESAAAAEELSNYSTQLEALLDDFKLAPPAATSAALPTLPNGIQLTPELIAALHSYLGRTSTAHAK